MVTLCSLSRHAPVMTSHQRAVQASPHAGDMLDIPSLPHDDSARAGNKISTPSKCPAARFDGCSKRPTCGGASVTGRHRSSVSDDAGRGRNGCRKPVTLRCYNGRASNCKHQNYIVCLCKAAFISPTSIAIICTILCIFLPLFYFCSMY